jgi:hypothetical protein
VEERGVVKKVVKREVVEKVVVEEVRMVKA